MPCSPPKSGSIFSKEILLHLWKNALTRIRSLNQLSCKSAIKFFVKSKFVKPTAEWRMKEANLKEYTVQLIYSLPFNVTRDTSLAIFQSDKIIHRMLPTNSTLFRDSLKQHDKCHLCDERQTLTHLFVTCSKAQLHLFWSLFVDWWNSRKGDTMT